MTKDKNITGYPSVDKPWMKYYDPAQIGLPLPRQTAFEYMRAQASKYLDRTAITFQGVKITYREFLAHIDEATKVLSQMGVRQNDRILFLVGNVPEAAYLFYAAVRIGAVSDFVDPRPDSVDLRVSANKMLQMIRDEHAKYLVSLDICYLAMISPIEKELIQIGVRKALIISPAQNMSSFQKRFFAKEYAALNSLKALLKKTNEQTVQQKALSKAFEASQLNLYMYHRLVVEAKNVTVCEAPYEPNRLAAITHSSGTSGTFPKAIPLTNEGINSYDFQMRRSNANHCIGDSSLHILPYFSAYGLGITHMGFSSGINMIEIPEFHPKDLGRYIERYKPNVLMGTPNWYLAIPTDPVLDRMNLSFIHVIGYGGDSMKPEDEMKVNDFLFRHGCTEKITKGHGMSETSGGASYAIGSYNKPGSLGIPMIDTTYGIVNPETKELIKFEDGENSIQGEFIISSPAIVAETLDEKAVIKHKKYHGKDFILTGDLGIMDRDGILYFLSRNDRAFTRFDGYKIKPYEIEHVIQSHPDVKECIISSFEDGSKHGKMPVAHIIIEKEVRTETERIAAAKKLVDDCFISNPSVSSRQIPAKIKFWDSFPITKNGKLDYKAIEKATTDNKEIFIDVDETSLSLGSIKVHV